MCCNASEHVELVNREIRVFLKVLNAEINEG